MTNTCIKSTTNYGQFKILKGNRNVNLTSPASKLLIPSIIETKGNISPILVNGKMEVLDGQTRLAVCKTTRQPLSYIVVSSSQQHSLSSQDIMTTLNQTNNGWKITDYMNKTADHGGKIEYRTLLNLVDKHRGVGVDAIISLAGLSSVGVKRGDDISLPKNLNKRINRLETVKEEYQHTLGNTIRPLMLARALKKIGAVHPKFDFKAAINGISGTLKARVPDKVVDIANMLIVAQNSKVPNTKSIPLF